MPSANTKIDIHGGELMRYRTKYTNRVSKYRLLTILYLEQENYTW